MKKIIFAILTAMIFLTACGKYNQPDVTALTDELCFIQGLDDMSDATPDDVKILYDIEPADTEDFSVRYSSKGGYADMIAVFKMIGSQEADYAEEALLDYKAARYEDFKGYAPLEAEKIENGKVLRYDNYVILLIVSNIDTAVQCADTEFTE